MLKINFEFRKGIFFIRLIGNLDEKNYKNKDIQIEKLIMDNKFKYVVINTNYLRKIDFGGLKYLIEVFDLIEVNESNIILCDKTRVIKELLNKDIQNIKSEIEVL